MGKWIALLLCVLASCSLLMPDVPSLPSVSTSAPAATTLGAVSQDVENSLWQYSRANTDQMQFLFQLSLVLLVFFFPSMRAPITFFLKSIFGLLAIGPDLAVKHLRYLYYQKYPQIKEDNKDE